MRCRHTLPDWHRHVVPAAEAPFIFAACRLLVREGERASDPRSIACSFWGHQPDCPVYDGPGGRAETPSGGLSRPKSRLASEDVPLGGEVAWPVRAPGATDGMRWVLIGLGVLSVVLLTWTAAHGLAVVFGKASPGRLMSATFVATVVSIVTHV